MDITAFNHFCQSLPATTYVVQWGGAHVWKVGGKVFALGGVGEDNQTWFTFKTSDQNYCFLESHVGYRPAPYFASRGMKWIQQFAASDAQDEELTYYLLQSYKTVALGLSKRKRMELGIVDFVES
ncbi:MmcQ/YjbR family DNA-binding protein [Vibrio hippocampi]|uniref:MmcQ/YjbR family DNA-binding protein n=1 Tax=Vibrio hippocampi TaxID=654686 RepID=A0ABN8DF74_9VIBR|nr:MmcQ/YjbR family DNA-binding protein [Vibrio hippocampi]CAH0525792.1 hypothetical protein VHP8226_01323 [Vibrio hippocampi]